MRPLLFLPIMTKKQKTKNKKQKTKKQKTKNKKQKTKNKKQKTKNKKQKTKNKKQKTMQIRVGILTVSDRAKSGEYEDKSGPALAEALRNETNQTKVVYLEPEHALVEDCQEDISSALRKWTLPGSPHQKDLIFTTGGTGFSPRDVTPEATKAVLDREAPGIVHLLLARSLLVTPHAALS